MSIDSPRNPDVGHRGRLRRAIQMMLVSSIFVAQPADSALKETPSDQQEKDYDYLFDKIRIVPDGTLKEEPDVPKSPIKDDPFCTPETCKPA